LLAFIRPNRDFSMGYSQIQIRIFPPSFSHPSPASIDARARSAIIRTVARNSDFRKQNRIPAAQAPEPSEASRFIE
jgi:hypothetical protein